MATKVESRKQRRLSAEDVLALWQEYHDTGDLRIRDRLVLTFAPLVKYIVYKKIREIPARCEVEDFISCGLEALIHSIERYDPERAAAIEQAKARFRAAFDRLPKREREVAILLYVKNLTLREIGDILGVSESRVCQIHSQLKRTLKSQLAEDSVLFSAVG